MRRGYLSYVFNFFCEVFMKKISFAALCGLFLAGCSYDMAMMGYPNQRYSEQNESNVAVYKGLPVPQNCKQISMVISDIDSNVQDIVDNLRVQAAEVGANYVNIDELSYSTGWFSSMDKATVATFYLCSDNQ